MPDLVTSEAELEAIYGQPAGPAVIKEIDHISEHYRRFIELSPFVVLATSGPEGLDCTPRGDPPGFVRVVDSRTVMLPDRRGNNRIDSLRNIVRDPRVALLFLIPGVGRTLRINGRARVTTEGALLEPLAVNGKVPRSGIVVMAEEIYFHCGKALIRSDLWDPAKHLRRSEFPSLGRILADQIGGISIEEAERLTAESYKTRLY